MKHKDGFLMVFASLLIASCALAQNNSQTTSDVPKDDLPQSVAAARCAYTLKDEACTNTNQANPGGHDPSGNPKLAQLSAQRPGPPSWTGGPRMGPAAYPRMWMSRPSPAHVLIGAIFGFGIGAALAVKAGPSTRSVLGLGALGAGIGAGMGADMASSPSRYYRRRGWPGEDEEASRSRPKSSRPGSAQPGSVAPSPTRYAGAPHPDPAPSNAPGGHPQQVAAETP